jgi:NADPH:quinone reductase-like Zn-dependent oxidoreductase
MLSYLTTLRRFPMNAAVVNAFRVAPSYTSFAEPVATEGEVLVNVSAVGLHRVVKALADGSHYASSDLLPMIPGVDGVGRLEDGTRVYFGMVRRPFGTFAERAVTAPSMCLPIPKALDDVTVAAIMNPGMSSWAALSRAQFVAGESVLILGATGVAGQLAVQVAKRLGARRVVAAGRNSQVLEELEQRGADAVISLSQGQETVVSSLRSEWVKDGFDVVLDYVWGHPAECLLEAISQKGRGLAASRIRFVQVGESAGPMIALPAATLRSGGLELLGSGFGSVSIEEIFSAVTKFLKEAEKEPFQIKTTAAPLSEIEALWNSAQQGARLVFQP